MTASSKQLGKLHELLTQVLTLEVEECIEEQEILVGMDPETDEPQYEMQRKPIAPALAPGTGPCLQRKSGQTTG